MRRMEREATMKLNPIGVIHTPFPSREGMLRSTFQAAGVKGTVQVFEAYRAGWLGARRTQAVIRARSCRLSELQKPERPWLSGCASNQRTRFASGRRRMPNASTKQAVVAMSEPSRNLNPGGSPVRSKRSDAATTRGACRM